jgi:predicted transcriptional regulator of viral defense system
VPAKLKDSEVIFSSREFALTHGLSLSAASHQLKTAARRGEIVRVTRGVWARRDHPHFSPLSCVPWVLGQEQGYVSFLTALHRHGAISQIPSVIQVATTGHSRKLSTPVGRFEFFQLKPEMMLAGVEWSETHVPFRMATPEKALLDTLYLATRKGRRFASLPELHRIFDDRAIASLLPAQRLPDPVARSIRMKLSLISRGRVSRKPLRQP